MYLPNGSRYHKTTADLRIFNWNALPLDLKATADPLEFQNLLRGHLFSKYSFEPDCLPDCFICKANWICFSRHTSKNWAIPKLPYFQCHIYWKGTHPYKWTPVWVTCMRVAWVGSPGWVVTPPGPSAGRENLDLVQNSKVTFLVWSLSPKNNLYEKI